jgi:hypothetical protein
MQRRLLAWLLTSLVSGVASSWAATPETLRCDREMRKTLEAIQAWRRSHDGKYPPQLVHLKQAGLIPADGAICPEVLYERPGADAAHRLSTSRGQGLDPASTYEYEMSDFVRSIHDRLYLPDGTPDYTRGEIKSKLLRRPFFEQVALLRCSSHRASAPSPHAEGGEPQRNLTATGAVYWSGSDWEDLWLNEVPYCARQANVLFGLKGPPFHSGRTPTLPEALDLRGATCAFGDHPWWWTLPMFEQETKRQWAAHLRPFFQEDHGRVLELGGTPWWIDGLVQLQGRVLTNENQRYRGPGRLAFPWERRGIPVGRHVRTATWLQGTVWTVPRNETVGWLVWHYQDGHEERVPVDYGVHTARFWADSDQLPTEGDFPEPVWSHAESAAKVGKERQLRIYRQSWSNPRPDTVVASLEFVSHRQSPGAPFLIAVNVYP